MVKKKNCRTTKIDVFIFSVCCFVYFSIFLLKLWINNKVLICTSVDKKNYKRRLRYFTIYITLLMLIEKNLNITAIMKKLFLKPKLNKILEEFSSLTFIKTYPFILLVICYNSLSLIQWSSYHLDHIPVMLLNWLPFPNPWVLLTLLRQYNWRN